MSESILEVRDLKTYFYTDEGVLPAVDGVSLKLREGETLAVVGESGCGKSVTSLSILGLVPSPPGKIAGGEILYKGKDLLALSDKEMRAIRGNEISMIFQEPMTSLNPVFPVGRQISESLKYHSHLDKEAIRRRAIEMIGLVGIPEPEGCFDRYPHELSGGMRQRIMIAMALACSPKILIADEPTTALDVTIQAQILGLMMSLQRQLNTAVILITHDLGIVAQTADNVMVMYAGEMVEYADVQTIFANPSHPYTVGLLRSVPKLNEEQETLSTIPGMVPGVGEYPAGCRFAPRCELAADRCFAEKPPLCRMRGSHKVLCWRQTGVWN